MSQHPESKVNTSSGGKKPATPKAATVYPGVTVDIQTLMRFRFGQGGTTKNFKRSAHQKHGNALSVFKGRGMTFSEVRHYQPGDDARSIDWRVTARRGGQPHTKIFQEEREQPVILVVDQRSHLFFGTQRCFKSVLACELGALLAWEALSAGDRTSHLIFTDTQIDHGQPRAGTQGVMHALQAMVQANQTLMTRNRPVQVSSSAEQLIKALNAVHHLAKPGAHVMIISDFLGLSVPDAYDRIKQALSPLVRHTYTYGLFLYDPFESSLPPADRMLLSDGIDRFELLSGNARLRAQYHGQFEQSVGLAQRLFSELACPLLIRGTHQETDARVLGLLEQSRRHPPPQAQHSPLSPAKGAVVAYD